MYSPARIYPINNLAIHREWVSKLVSFLGLGRGATTKNPWDYGLLRENWSSSSAAASSAARSKEERDSLRHAFRGDLYLPVPTLSCHRFTFFRTRRTGWRSGNSVELPDPNLNSWPAHQQPGTLGKPRPQKSAQAQYKTPLVKETHWAREVFHALSWACRISPYPHCSRSPGDLKATLSGGLLSHPLHNKYCSRFEIKQEIRQKKIEHHPALNRSVPSPFNTHRQYQLSRASIQRSYIAWLRINCPKTHEYHPLFLQSIWVLKKQGYLIISTILWACKQCLTIK